MKNGFNILFLSDNFPPEANAPAIRTFEHASEWVRQGCSVTIVTCTPNFPHGKSFEGYKNHLWQWEEMEGLQILRVWTFLAANAGFFRRTLDFASFAITGLLGGLFIAWHKRPDIIVATSPQFFAAIAGFVLAFLIRRPFVMEVRDLWPHSIRAVGKLSSGTLFNLLERIELFLYSRAALIVVVTHSFRHDLIKRGVEPRKICVVTNGANLSLFADPPDRSFRENLGLSNKFLVGYVGTIGLAHQLETLLECAALLQRDELNQFHFLLVGSGARKEALKRQAHNLALHNVTFMDPVSRNEVANILPSLDAALIHLKRNHLFRTVIPSKLFEAMAAGVPVLHGVEGESAEIVQNHNVGLTFTPGNASQLRQQLQRLEGDPDLTSRLSKNGLEAAPLFDRKKLARSMLESLAAVADKETAS